MITNLINGLFSAIQAAGLLFFRSPRSSFLSKSLATFLFLSVCITVKSQRLYWQQEVNFRIDVSLHDKDHSLDGFVDMQYINHSPDTLSFIWIHLWSNAYKNDRTAFSDQLLENGRTDFYFSDQEQKGYINRLDFRVNGQIASVEDHPEFIDIVKIVLSHPLPPGDSLEITTPFHEQLPYSFSRGGYVGQSYQITQWYPKPAVYDQKGWHPMPYLDQGEFYSEFGHYAVKITVPSDYAVAATGELSNLEEKKWMTERKNSIAPVIKKTAPTKYKSSSQPQHSHPASKDSVKVDQSIKVLEYHQDNIHDFAWFADKNFLVLHDTLQLKSGKIIEVNSFFQPGNNSYWVKSISFIKNAVLFYSDQVGEYPYATVSAVETRTGFEGGMEYPTITNISPTKSEKELEYTILHEVGHNWFCGALGSNERSFPWLDEGVNTYYENRYKRAASNSPSAGKINWLKNKWPSDIDQFFLEIQEQKKLDQPINTSAEVFTEMNYYLIPYQKAARWLKQIEDSAGTKIFDRGMQAYFQRWKFKHPYPEDFQTSLEENTSRNWSTKFDGLSQSGPLNGTLQKKKTKLTFLGSEHQTDKYNYIGISPALGYNVYDQFMAGVLVHNYNLVPQHLQFQLAPLYATGSRQLNGLGTVHYSWFTRDYVKKISIGLSGERFSSLSGIDSNNSNIFGGFYKIAPYLRLTFSNHSPRNSMEKWIEFKTYVIGEKSFTYSQKSSDSLYYPAATGFATHYINQLTFKMEDYRALYPYQAAVQIQQGSDFYRLNLNGIYFFNYAKGGGLTLRLFAAKFGYVGGKTVLKQSETSIYQPKLTASRGEDDYTYENDFIGRNESTGFPSQQIMMRDGGLKIRTDLFQGLQGRSDNWVTAININTTLPNHLFPVKLPVKIFLDIGTYSDAWGSQPPTSRFLYVGGLQISLLKDIINIYIPIFYSSNFSNSLKTVPEENTFWKRISFSIDVQNVNFRRIFKNIP